MEREIKIEGQDERFARAWRVLADAIDEHVFPGAAASVLVGNEVVALKGSGRFTYEADSPAVLGETIYDLASVTKVLATTAMAMLLYERGTLDIEAPVAALAPEFGGGGDDRRRAMVTVRMLLAHSSGLPEYARLFEKCASRDELIHSAMTMPLEADPMTRAAYSDIGFIILGEILQRLAGEPLDAFCQREIFGPLGMANTGFRPPVALRPQIPPTVDDRIFRHRVIQGEVHDENASVMGGVSGHAGLFGNALDVARFARCILKAGTPMLSRETVDLFAARETSPTGTSRAMGWDTPSQPSQSGQYFSPRSIGHLGYTGTSLWIDRDREVAITLLTNRTWPDRSTQAIKQVRPKFHDAVIEALR